jgi:trimethylamine--corrinoid protein Co-methyltransferase
VSESRPISTRPARLDLRIPDDNEAAALHERALRLLADEGVLIEGAATREALADVAHSGEADAVRLDREKVEELLAKAPSTFTLGARTAAYDIEVGSGALFLGTGGPAALTLSAGAGEPRPATGADLAALCRLADALPEVAVLCGPPVQPPRESALGALQICLAAAGKHLHLMTLHSPAEAEAAAAIAEAVAGGEEAMRERPPLSLAGALETALVFARHGLPAAAAARLAPSAAPPDPAEAAARRHAAVLAACVAVQAVAPGSPFLYSTPRPDAGAAPTSGTAEPDAGAARSSGAADPDAPAAGAPAAIGAGIAARLAARVGLPVVAPVLATRAPAPDWQACSENALASLCAALARVDLTTGAGTLAGGRVSSAVALVLDTEIHSWNAAIAAGVEVDEETLALDAIRQVGIGGNYLGQRHTRRHMKDVWRPRLLDRSSWDAWVAGGRRGSPDAAAELVRTTLADHVVPPLEAAVADRINEIIVTVQ